MLPEKKVIKKLNYDLSELTPTHRNTYKTSIFQKNKRRNHIYEVNVQMECNYVDADIQGKFKAKKIATATQHVSNFKTLSITPLIHNLKTPIVMMFQKY